MRGGKRLPGVGKAHVLGSSNRRLPALAIQLALGLRLEVGVDSASHRLEVIVWIYQYSLTGPPKRCYKYKKGK